MRSARTVNSGSLKSILLAGKQVEFRLIPSKAATKLRVRVGIAGVEVIQPSDRDPSAAYDFLRANTAWIINELERVKRFRSIRKPSRNVTGQILFRGELTPVQIEKQRERTGANRVVYDCGKVVIRRSAVSHTMPARSLENWLRRQARREIVGHLNILTAKLKRAPGKVLIMDQRTKWGNCSALRNLSFNWRLILAPKFVLQYLVTHEAVHLAIPDHSQKFWLTVRSLCPETERAKQWLCADGHRLLTDLDEVCGR